MAIRTRLLILGFLAPLLVYAGGIAVDLRLSYRMVLAGAASSAGEHRDPRYGIAEKRN